MSLSRILSSEPLPLHPTELRDGVYSKAAIDKYIRDLHNYLRRLTGFFTADNITTTIDEGSGGQLAWDTQPWQKAYTTFSTSASWPTLTATSTKPSGQNVYTPKGTRVLIAGLTDVITGADVRLVGWRKIGSIWYPEAILAFTPSGDAGITPDGVEIDAALTKFPTSHTVHGGNASRYVYQATTGTTSFGLISVEHNGVELVQVDCKTTGGSTKVNALTSFA